MNDIRGQRKPKSKGNPFAKVDALEKHGAHATLSEKQALSKVYQGLDSDTKVVLEYCKLSRKYYVGYTKDGELRAIYGNVLYFYFNRALQRKYGLLNPNKVREGLVELVSKGFIDVIENNGNQRKKNVYAFSDKWLSVERGEPIKLSQEAQTFIQGKKKV